ncbi:MAG TPA: hypothetical protein VGF38_22430 [Ktedonobacterales bacterium]|jgi:hypothetical protein
MIPPLRPDGTLPPGTHRATLADVLTAYPAGNQQRQMLNDSLVRVVNQLWRLDATFTIFVDGSYVTGKAEPNDIDLLIITMRYNELSLQQYLDRVCPVEAVSMHIYVEPQLPNAMLDFFTTTRLGTVKGIIEVTSA